MSRIQAQAAKLWQTLNAPETFSTYKSVFAVTWNILRELFLLLWLSLMWVPVLADRSISLGRSTRTWINSQKESGGDRSAAEMGKAVQSALKQGFASTVSQAKRQLGIPVVLPVESAPTTPENGVAQSKEPAEIS